MYFSFVQLAEKVLFTNGRRGGREREKERKREKEKLKAETLAWRLSAR